MSKKKRKFSDERLALLREFRLRSVFGTAQLSISVEDYQRLANGTVEAKDADTLINAASALSLLQFHVACTMMDLIGDLKRIAQDAEKHNLDWVEEQLRQASEALLDDYSDDLKELVLFCLARNLALEDLPEGVAFVVKSMRDKTEKEREHLLSQPPHPGHRTIPRTFGDGKVPT